MNFRLLIILILAGIGFAGRLPAQTTEFSYDGRVRSGGVPFDGNGLFKFAIVSGDGAICYWSNDGVTLTGNEPTSSVQISVSAGFFSVIMGDGSIANMAPLDASIFNTDERVLLRVWFSDGVNGFQKLNPDRPITNPSLIGLQDQKELTMYVNPIAGNDRFPGNTPKKPKKTIQAAWNALPRLLSTTATIQLADGEYYESVLMQGKYVPGDCRIVLRGNPVSSSSVSILGSADHATSMTPIRGDIFTIIQQKNIRFESLRIANAKGRCIMINQGSVVEIQNCQLLNTICGINVQDQCSIFMARSIISDSVSAPFMLYAVYCEASLFDAHDSQFLHVQPRNLNGVSCNGPSAALNGRVKLTGCITDGWDHGVVAIYESIIGLVNGGTIGRNIIRNCNIGAYILSNSSGGGVSASSGNIIYQNCIQDIVMDSSSSY